MSQNMKTLLPNNFRRKCWKVTAYLELFWVATGGRNFTGGGTPGPHLKPPLPRKLFVVFMRNDISKLYTKCRAVSLQQLSFLSSMV